LTPKAQTREKPSNKQNNEMMPCHSLMTTALQLKFFLLVVAVFENDKETDVLFIAGDMQS
jgi:hypothetical protein